MNKHPLLHFLPVVPEEQKRIMLLKVDKEELSVFVYTIVLVEVLDHYLTFHTADVSRHNGIAQLKVKGTLCQMKEALGRFFLQPNQSMLINHTYLQGVGQKRYVHMHYPEQLPPIMVSRAYKDSFFADRKLILDNMQDTNQNPPPAL